MHKISDNIYGFSTGGVFFAETKKIVHSGGRAKSDASSGGDIVSWGEENNKPQSFFKKLIKTDAAAGGLDVLVSAHYGTGFKLYKDEETDKGVVSKEQLLWKYEEIQDFFERVRWQVFMSDIIADYETFNIAFVEYLLSPNFDKIISVKRLQTSHCRFEVPGNSGRVERVHINSDWENLDEELTDKVHLFGAETYWEELKEYCKKKKINKFVIPICSTLMTENFYPQVKWHSAFRNGWVEVVLSVPEFKKYMFENQLNMKCVVYVADDFFSHKYGKNTWDDFTADEKEEKRKELVEAIDDHMSGNKASGRSLTAPYFRDSSGNLIKGIEVVPIDNKIKDGGFLPDAASGNSQILFSMGVDPCLLGAGIPGGKSLSGSGSDKREAYTILCTRMPIHRMRVLEVFTMIRNWNGWDRSLYGNFPNIVLTTLDKETSGATEVVN